jgi:hypothetical protein
MNTWRNVSTALRASGLTVCLLVNSEKPKAEWKRIVNGFIPAETIQTQL